MEFNCQQQENIKSFKILPEDPLHDIKLKRTLTRGIQPFMPAAEVSLAWLNELGAHDKTKRIFEIDPYGEVHQFRENLYSIFKHSADGMTDAWMHLTIGPEKAFLVDTGFGIGNLKGLVDMLAGGKPVIVVNTHPHGDHCMGNSQFGKAYVHEIAAPMLAANQDPNFWDKLFDKDGNCIWLQFDRKDIPPFIKYEVIGVPDGYKFNLGGGYEIELVHMAGHHGGHAGFIDKQNRIFFGGDDCTCSGHVVIDGCRRNSPFYEQYHQYFTVTAYRDRMEKLCKRLDEFDYVFPSHSILDIDKSILQHLLDTANKIIENPLNYDGRFSYAERPFEVMFKYVEGADCIAYTLESVGNHAKAGISK